MKGPESQRFRWIA